MIAFNKINNLIDALNDRSVKLNVEAYEDCGGFFQLKSMDQTQTKKKLIKADKLKIDSFKDYESFDSKKETFEGSFFLWSKGILNKELFIQSLEKCKNSDWYKSQNFEFDVHEYVFGYLELSTVSRYLVEGLNPIECAHGASFDEIGNDNLSFYTREFTNEDSFDITITH